jgi:hypothetical protein
MCRGYGVVCITDASRTQKMDLLDDLGVASDRATVDKPFVISHHETGSDIFTCFVFPLRLHIS